MNELNPKRKINSELIKAPKTKKQPTTETGPRYIVEPRYIQERNKDSIYTKASRITDKWEPSNQDEGINGNVRPIYTVATGKFSFKDQDSPFHDDKTRGMYEVIPSSLLLYRLLCLYKAEVITEGPDGYKCIWWITLKHKATGDKLTLGEWKGAAGIWTSYYSLKELPSSFKKDILSLLNLLVSETCPHPYDGLVAGSVA